MRNKNNPIKIQDVALRMTQWVGSTASLTVHTIIFVGAFILISAGFSFERVLLVLTTAVSLEAIYLSIFIQISINRSNERLSEVSEDIEDIQENIEEIQENVEDIQEDIGEEEPKDKNLDPIHVHRPHHHTH